MGGVARSAGTDGAAWFSGGRGLAGALAGRRHAEGAGGVPSFGAHGRESAPASASGHQHRHTPERGIEAFD